jgi:hypothetical protein
MSTTTVRRRALLAVAGATAGLTAVLTPTTAQASPVRDVETASDVFTDEQAQTDQVDLTAEQAGVALSCSRTARISADRVNNRYKVSGSVSCNANGFLRMRCKPVHRHTFFWHSHAWAFDVTRFGSSLSESSGPINGTNGDTYKANCQYWFNGVYLGALESGTITL